MERFVLNKNAQIKTGARKIHKISCNRAPKKENAIELGECICPVAAQNKAKKYFENVSGCKYCCKEIC